MQALPVYALLRASFLDFRPRLGNRCSAIAATVRNGSACSSRSGNEVRVRFYSSLPQRRIARLQHRCEAQAGTGCHEGGIILSKKPPEWHLSLPQQRYASDSNLCRCKEEWPACSGRCCKEDSPACSKLSAGRFDSGGKGGC